MSQIKLQHPRLSEIVQWVDREAVDAWKSSGWVEATDDEQEKPEQAPVVESVEPTGEPSVMPPLPTDPPTETAQTSDSPEPEPAE